MKYTIIYLIRHAETIDENGIRNTSEDLLVTLNFSGSPSNNPVLLFRISVTFPCIGRLPFSTTAPQQCPNT